MAGRRRRRTVSWTGPRVVRGEACRPISTIGAAGMTTPPLRSGQPVAPVKSQSVVRQRVVVAPVVTVRHEERWATSSGPATTSIRTIDPGRKWVDRPSSRAAHPVAVPSERCRLDFIVQEQGHARFLSTKPSGRSARGSARALGARGCGFESRRPDHLSNTARAYAVARACHDSRCRPRSDLSWTP